MKIEGEEEEEEEEDDAFRSQRQRQCRHFWRKLTPNSFTNNHLRICSKMHFDFDKEHKNYKIIIAVTIGAAKNLAWI